MSWKRYLNLETMLVVLMTAFLTSSVINYLGHSPRWTLLIAVGLAAVFFFARPKTALLLLFLLTTAYLLAAHLSELFVPEISLFVHGFNAELQAWEGIYHFPGELITLVFSLLTIFVLVYLQLHLVSKDQNDWPIILLGFMVYLWLWFQHYPRAEKELIIFFALAFPLSALLYARTKSTTIKLSYKTGLLSLGALCSLAVAFAPYQAPLYYDEVFALIRSQLPALHRMQRVAGESTWNLPGAGETAGPEGQVGYATGGELGGGLTETTRPVLDLELLEGSFPRSLYLRGQTSDHYTGRSWRTTDFGEAGSLAAAFQDVAIYDNEVKMRVSYLHPEQDLFSLFPTTALELLGEEDAASPGYRVDLQGNLEAHRPDFQGTYLLTGKTITPVDLRAREPQAELVKDISQLYPFLQLPPDLPQRVKDLSHEITAGAETELEKVEKIKDYLKQFPYRLDMPAHPPGEDFVDHFLFELGEGYCTYYASAMAVLLRVQEIPSRYVVGYRVPAGNYLEILPGVTGSPPILQVRQNQAHAWVEVFLQGYGWAAFEPTQPFEILDLLQEGAAGEAVEEEPWEEPGQEFGEEAGQEGEEEHPQAGEEEEEEQEPGEEREAGLERETGEEEDEVEFAAGNGGPSGEAETTTTSPEEETGKSFPPGGWAFILTGAFFIGAWYVYYELSYAKNPVDLYSKVIRLRSLFHLPPGPGETPGQIVARLKEELPELAEDLELMKHCYHISYYSTSKDALENYRENLKSLPLKTVRLYLKKAGFLRFARGLLGISNGPEEPGLK